MHIDSEKGFRGGQQQAVYIYEALIEREIPGSFFCKKGSKLEEYFKARKIHFNTLPLLGEFDIISAYKIAKFAQKNKQRILHLHSAHALALGILSKLFCRKLKLIAVRRVDFSINKNYFSKLKYSNNLIDQIIAISENIKSVLTADGLQRDRIKVIRSGVDIYKFTNCSKNKQLLRDYDLSNDSFIVGTVAAMADHKDYPNLLRAAEVVIKKCPNVYFISAGEGREEKKVKELAKRLRLGNRFIFLGHRNDIGPILKSMDIFVLSSKKEGLGTSTIDAMAVGLPVIGTDAGGIPEVIQNGFNGTIVPKQDHQKLASAIIDLVLDEKKRKQFGLNSLQRVKIFSRETMIDEYLRLYSHLEKL